MTTKVFVGNLDFNTTDQDLENAFSPIGSVKRGVIITRGRRPLGYGFVEFHSPEAAFSSVEKLNKTNLLGRQIKVELAKDPNDFQPKSLNTEGGGKETGPAPRRRRRENFTENVEDETQASNPPPNVKSQPEENFSGVPPRNPRRRRKNKKIRPTTEKVLSKTTLFVANLPFSVNDEGLKAIFEGTNAKSARVVRTRNGRSRGYGFVEFENENDQINAMKARDATDVNGENSVRKISVTISNSVSTPPSEETQHVPTTGEEIRSVPNSPPLPTSAPLVTTTTTTTTGPGPSPSTVPRNNSPVVPPARVQPTSLPSSTPASGTQRPSVGPSVPNQQRSPSPAQPQSGNT